jgi:DNA-binding HxlR family transcriptional regulator
MLPPSCERVINILEGRGKVTVILHLLSAGTQRFSKIERTIRGISQRRLVQCLRELEADGIVRRVVHHQVPPRVDYSLTALGAEFFGRPRSALRLVRFLPFHWWDSLKLTNTLGNFGAVVVKSRCGYWAKLPAAAFHAGRVAGIHHGLALLAARWVAHQTFP